MSESGSRSALDVVAGVIRGADGSILISQRAAQADQGGLWEFPGGKLEAGETLAGALQRELREELGIAIRNAVPLLEVTHDYPQRRVRLHVFEVTDWEGDARPCEGQPLRWVSPESLLDYDFPAANLPIISAARLPRWCLITPHPERAAEWLAQLEACVIAGAQLVQVRAPALGLEAYAALASRAIEIAHAQGARIILNADPELALALGADGVHLSASRLRTIAARPLPRHLWVSAACHDHSELALARAIGADFAFVSPVQATTTHPDASPLGWPALGSLARGAGLPVYALGGLDMNSMAPALAAGCLGVATISAGWRAPATMVQACAEIFRERPATLKAAAL
jgi:8-oxo-dGTP diphosphatase